MSHNDDKLIYMANQICTFFKSQGESTAAASTQDHIRKFWDPRMRAKIIARLEHGGEGMDPIVRTAIESLKKQQAAA